MVYILSTKYTDLRCYLFALTLLNSKERFRMLSFIDTFRSFCPNDQNCIIIVNRLSIFSTQNSKTSLWSSILTNIPWSFVMICIRYMAINSSGHQNIIYVCFAFYGQMGSMVCVSVGWGKANLHIWRAVSFAFELSIKYEGATIYSISIWVCGLSFDCLWFTSNTDWASLVIWSESGQKQEQKNKQTYNSSICTRRSVDLLPVHGASIRESMHLQLVNMADIYWARYIQTYAGHHHDRIYNRIYDLLGRSTSIQFNKSRIKLGNQAAMLGADD